MFRRLLLALVLILVVSVASAAAPEYNPAFGKSTALYGWYEAGARFIALALGSDGSVSTTQTVGGNQVSSTNPLPAYDARGRVSATQQYNGNLSTSTPALLTSLASWTPPCILQLQVNGVAFYGTATTTATTVWSGQRLAAYDVVKINPSVDTYALSFIASSSAVASYSILVHTLVP